MNIRKFATIAVLVVSSFAATNVAPTKAELDSMYDKAFREFSAANYEQALKELDGIRTRGRLALLPREQHLLALIR